MEPSEPVVVSQPPRALPLSARLVIIFGGMLAPFGWFFFSFGMVFVFLFAGNGDYSSLYAFSGTLETANGKITRVDSTHFSEGGSKHHSGTPIYAYHYAFAAGTRNCEGISYRTGQGAREGDNVTVEFPAGKPGFSRIRGMRRTPFGPFVAFVLVFPLAGLTLVLPSVWRGWRNVRLLVTGETAQAVFLSKEYTNVRINKQTVYKLTFQFTDKLGQTRRAIARTTTPEWLQSHPSELVFYDAVRPEKSVVLRSLPGGQVISRRGELLPCSFGSTLGAVVGPCLGTSVIVGGLLIKLL